MEDFLKLAQLVALLSASALCVYLIVVLVRLNGVLAVLQKEFVEFNRHMTPVLENIMAVTERLKSITTNVDDQVALFKGSLESLKHAADNVVRFEERLEHRIEEPVGKLFTLVAAFIARMANIVTNRSTSN